MTPPIPEPPTSAERSDVVTIEGTRLDEIELKLTALIAALNKSDEVDAAIEGRLLSPDADGSCP